MTNTISPELKKRLFTAIGGAILLLGLVAFGGSLAVMFIVTVITLGMVFEFSEITFALKDRIEKRYVLLTISWFISLLDMILPQSEGFLLMLSFFLLFGYYLWAVQNRTDDEMLQHFRELALSLFALVYLVFGSAYFLKLYESAHGGHWCLLFVFINWAGDTAAYFGGKKYGKHKLYPRISPKKTREGALAGLGAGVVFAILYKLFVFKGLGLFAALVFALLVGVVAQIGDLCESFLKRAFDKKDSGSLLPGHGGFLDRFDGMVLSLPVAYIFVRLFG